MANNYIDTAEKLSGLPSGTIVRDRTGHAWVKGDLQWWSSHPYDAEHNNDPAKVLPAEVIWDKESSERPPLHVQVRTLLVLLDSVPQTWNELGIEVPQDSEYPAFMRGANTVATLLEEEAGVVFTPTEDGAFEWRIKDDV